MDKTRPLLRTTRISQSSVLCQILKTSEVIERVNENSRRLVVIFDVSGSMGDCVAIIHKNLLHLVAEYKIDNTTIVTFGVKSFRYDFHPHKQFSTWKLPGLEGDTRMGAAVKIVLDNVLQSSTEKLFQILIITDGGVGDISTILANVADVPADKFNDKILQVCGIRIGSGGDTKALTCFFKYHNHPVIQQELVDVSSKTEIPAALTTYFKSVEKGCTFPSCSVSHPQKIIRLFPCDEILVNSLSIYNKGFFIIDCTSEQESEILGNITVSGNSCDVEPCPKLNEETLVDYLTNLEQKIRNFKVLGDENPLKSLKQFLESLQGLLNQESEDTSNDDSLSVTGRIKILRRKARIAQKSIISKIQAILGVGAVHSLNSQQQASFLREISGDTSTGRRLAKRHFNESGVDSDVRNLFTTELATILENYRTTTKSNSRDEKTENYPRSFFSLGANSEIFSQCLEELKELDELDLASLLQCFGLVGVCFSGSIGNFPDPWLYRVNKVYFGAHLGQHDLWMAKTQGGGAQAILKPPGHVGEHDQISGVDVILFSGNEHEEKITKLYLKNREINKLHCSIGMRQAIVSIPFDDIAMKTAVIYQMVHQIFKEGSSEVSWKELWWNVNTLKFMIGDNRNVVFGPEITKGILSDNPEVFFTGDLGVSSSTKIIGLLLDLTPEEGRSLDLARIARAIISFEMYHHIRTLVSAEDRKKTLHDILQIDLAKNRTHAKDPFEKEPEDVEFYEDFDPNIAYRKCKQFLSEWKKTENIIKFLHALYRSYSVKGIASEGETYTGKSSTWIFGISCDISDFLTGNVVQAVLCSKLQDRVDTQNRKYLLPPLTSSNECMSYLHSIVRNEFYEDYKEQLGKKHRIEEEKRMTVAVEKLVWDVEPEQFISDLVEFIPRRDSIGYQMLVQQLSDSDQVPILQEKVWILVTGRKFLESESSPVWNLGNVCTQAEMNKFEELWYSSCIQDSNWDDLLAVWKDLRYGTHCYRSGQANRHGHANECPKSDYSKKGYYKARQWNKTNRGSPKGAEEFDTDNSTSTTSTSTTTNTSTTNTSTTNTSTTNNN